MKSLESISNYRKVYYVENFERISNYGKVWRLEHPEYMSNYCKVWRLEHPDYYKVRRLEMYNALEKKTRHVYSQNCIGRVYF